VKSVASYDAVTDAEGPSGSKTPQVGDCSPKPVSWKFIQQEARRLQSGFFHVLVQRGGESSGVKQLEAVSPKCIVCTSHDLATLGRAVTSHPSVTALAVGLPINILHAIRASSVHVGASQDVVCWLEDGRTAGALKRTLGFQRSDTAPGGIISSKCEEIPQRSLEDHDEFQGASMPSGTISLMCSVLSRPRPIDGILQGSLMAALRAQARCEFGQSLPERLQHEVLDTFLMPFLEGDAVEPCTPSELCVRSEESRAGSIACTGVVLLRVIRQEVESVGALISSAQNKVRKIRVTERLVRQQCSDSYRVLEQSQRLDLELRCLAVLQSLWTARQGTTRICTGGRRTCSSEEEFNARSTLNLCVLFPDNHAQDKSPRKSRLSPFGISASLPTERNSAPSVLRSTVSNLSIGSGGNHAPSTPGVQILETARCPCRRVAAAGAAMGLDNMSLEKGIKHRRVRDLGQAIHAVLYAIQKLQLDSTSVLQRGDPYGIGSAILVLIDIVGARAIDACKQLIRAGRRVPVECESDDLNESILGNELKQAESHQGEEHFVREFVSQFVYRELHTKLFPAAPTANDELTAHRLSRLAWLRPRHLELPDMLVNTPQVDQAVALLRNLHKLHSPVEMLAGFVESFHRVTEGACLQKRLHAKGADVDALGADESQPLFIMVMLRANPPMLNSMLAYIELFTPKQLMLREQGYALMQAQGAVAFCEHVREQDLGGLEPGEWDQHCSRRGNASS